MNKNPTFTLVLPREFREQLRDYAKTLGLPVGAVVRRVLLLTDFETAEPKIKSADTDQLRPYLPSGGFTAEAKRRREEERERKKEAEEIARLWAQLGRRR